MKKTNIATLRAHLSEVLEQVERGKEVEIQKRNISIAKIIPMPSVKKNKTKLGRGKGTVQIKGSLVEPISDKDWEMHD